jgi:endoglucanase
MKPPGTLLLAAASLLIFCPPSGFAQDAAPLIPNTGFELDADGNGWPDGWAGVKEGGSREVEEGNHFLRLESPEAGKMVMLYQEIPLPTGVEALEVKWKQRVTNLKKGKSPWFDARFMMEFMDAERGKVGPSPKPVATGKDTEGWVEKSTAFLVPPGAATLKFMPCLFQVNTGTFDIDDLVIRPVDAEPVRVAAAAAEAKRAEEMAAKLAGRQSKAANVLATHGSLIPGGDFEAAAGKKNVVEEEGNHFLRLQTTEPGKMVMDYRTIDVPADVKALELTWKHRVTGLKKGEKPWFDARILMEWKDAGGGKIAAKPSPPYAQKDTEGWVEKSTSFLVPEGAATLVLMPSLFQAAAGTYDLDNFVLKPTDPAPILARKADAERQAAARHVPDEEPNPAKWPKMLKVVGNRLHDTDGKEVWLQGVNAGGLETLPQDEQPVKSLVVAIDDWKANCVRVPMKEEFWWGKSPYQNDGGEAYRQKLDKMITLAANRGAYIVIDLHRYRAPKQEHADFWKEFAAKYKDHPAVLFDILNEPHGISWKVWRDGGFVGNKEGTDESAFLTEEEKKKNQGFESVGMQGLVDAVRSTGAKNIIIAGGIFWCNDLTGVVNGYALEDKTGNGIMYSWHTYNWHKNWAEKVVPAAEKYPIFLGEVGADVKKMEFIPAHEQEDPHTWVPDMLGFIQKYKINWTGWCFHPRATPVMISDWDYTPTPFWGEYAKRALAGEKFELKKMR